MNTTVSRRDALLAGAGLAAIAIGGCTTLDPARFDWTVRPPADVWMRPEGPAQITEALRQSLNEGESPGVVAAVARQDKLAYFEALGLRNVETSEPMRKDDIFRMMSSSKPVTAVAVLMMQDAGKLSIEDPVSKYIPAFAKPKVATLPPDRIPDLLASMTDPARREALKAQVEIVSADREITIRDLLTHTSGLSSGLGLAPGPTSLIAEGVPVGPNDTLADRVPKLGALVLDFQPGSRFGYSAIDGFDTLLHIVELTSGLPADTFLRERLFAPLDMIDTGFKVPPEKQSRLLPLYSRKGAGWKQASPTFAGSPETTYFSGAGGLTGTAHDFLHFELMLLGRGSFNGRRILRPETVRQMTTNQVGSLFADWIPVVTKGAGFGLGVRIVMDANASSASRSVGSFGWGGAYGTESWVDPVRELAVVNFIQCADGRRPGNPEHFAKSLLQAFPVQRE